MIEGKEVVLGVTGGIAAFKACELASQLTKLGARVTTVMTEAAQKFVGPVTFQALTHQPVITDMFETVENWDLAHVSVADRADLFLIAPATANIIGKFATGIADDFLSTTVLATRAPVLLAPAMNKNMYSNPVVQENLAKLRSRGFHIIEPETGRLACGDVGEGRLPSVDVIIQRAMEILAPEQDLSGMTVVVTAGPTEEPLDPVRYITNPSTGKMGFAVAAAARARGAEVILITGPTSLQPAEGIRCVRVRTAREMKAEVDKVGQNFDVFVGAAAPVDYAPASVASEKMKKREGGMTLELENTPDILLELGKRKSGQVLVGFSAETSDLIENAKVKLNKKNLDLVVANDVTAPGAGFGTDTNIVTLIDKDGNMEQLPQMTKREVANRILDKIKTLGT